MSIFLHHIFSSSHPLGETFQDKVLVFILSMRRSSQQGGGDALVKWLETHKKWWLSSNAEHCCRWMWLKCQMVFFTVSTLSVHQLQGHAAESFQPMVSCSTYSWSCMTLLLCSLSSYFIFFGPPFPSTYSPWQRQNPGPTWQFLCLPGSVVSSDVN